MQINVTFHGRRGEKVTAEACIAGRISKRKKRGAWGVGSTKKAAARVAVAMIANKL